MFLVLAQTNAGLSCFLVERGPGMEFQRLKDKLGTRSLPSAEVELRGARGELVGQVGRGVLEAVHHARHRRAFGERLDHHRAMVTVLADLAVESEAATSAALRLARAHDEPGAVEFRRFATAVMKYWICKRAPGHAAEALKCLGGNGYVEDLGLPRLYRDSPLNSIWEGSGNVAALDVLRALAREPAGLAAFLAERELVARALPA